MIAVDESPVSKEALDYAIRNLIVSNDTVKLLSVVDPADRPAIMTPAGVALEYPGECQPDKEQLDTRNRILKDYESLVRKRGTTGVSASTVVGCMGTSADHGRQICQYAAENGADMIVIGSRGMGSMKKKILGFFGLGSVSSFVVDHATVPNVLVHRHQGS